MAKLRKYARDFSELTEADRLSIANAIVRIGREASEKARKANLSEAGRSLPQSSAPDRGEG